MRRLSTNQQEHGCSLHGKGKQGRRQQPAGLKNHLPKPLRRRPFTKPADLHKTCTRMARLHVHPPLESSIFVPFASKSNPKARSEGAQKATPGETRKSYEKSAKMMPRDTPRAPKIAPKSHSDGKGVPQSPQGYPAGRKRCPKGTLGR